MVQSTAKDGLQNWDGFKVFKLKGIKNKKIG